MKLYDDCYFLLLKNFDCTFLCSYCFNLFYNLGPCDWVIRFLLGCLVEW